MPLLRSIIYTGSLGGTRGRLANVIVEGVAWLLQQQRVAGAADVDEDALERRDGTVRFINRCVFASVNRRTAKKQECREFPETFASFSTWRLGRRRKYSDTQRRNKTSLIKLLLIFATRMNGIFDGCARKNIYVDRQRII